MIIECGKICKGTKYHHCDDKKGQLNDRSRIRDEMADFLDALPDKEFKVLISLSEKEQEELCKLSFLDIRLRLQSLL